MICAPRLRWNWWVCALSQAWQHWANGTALDLVDPRLGDQWPRHEVLECIQIGLLCIQEVAADRPSMSEIVLMLSSHTITTPVPLHPPVLARSRNFESSETMDATKFDQYNRKALQQSVNDVTISELTPRSWFKELLYMRWVIRKFWIFLCHLVESSNPKICLVHGSIDSYGSCSSMSWCNISWLFCFFQCFWRMWHGIMPNALHLEFSLMLSLDI